MKKRRLGTAAAATLVSCVIISIAALAPPGVARGDGAAPAAAPRPELDPATEKAIAAGLDALARLQSRSGAYPTRFRVATVSMAGLALLASGSTPSAGPRNEAIERCIVHLLDECLSREGFFSELGTHDSGMYGHGFATLFLSEALGMIEDPILYERTRTAIRRAVHVIQHSQNSFGGWNADKNPHATDDGSGAIAVMQVTALRAARNAGIFVSKATIDRAKKYLLEMMSTDGWYQYNYHHIGQRNRSSGLTGPGAYMLGALDLHDDGKYEKGIRNLMGAAPFLGARRRSDSGWDSWYFYTLFYASLAIFQYGGDDWARWYPAMRDEVVKKQRGDGTWTGPDAETTIIDTAFAVLALELPYRYLPLFQEGGRGGDRAADGPR